MKQSGKLLMGLVVCAVAFAQLPSYDLGSYIRPDTKTHWLEAQLNMNGISNEYNNYLDSTGLLFEGESRYRNNLSLRYRQTQVTRRMEQSLSAGINTVQMYRAFKKYRVPDTESDTSKMAELGTGITVSRTYYSAKNFFFEMGATVNYSGSIIDDIIGMNDSRNVLAGHNNTVLAYAPIKLGKGRIENVSSAQQAVFILEELVKQGRVRSDISPEEITLFADYICRLNSRRYFDTRLQRIEEIESLDSFMVAQQLTVDRDAHFYTSLNDMWSYGNNVNRLAGNKAAFVFIPGYSCDIMKIEMNGIEADMFHWAPMLDVGLELDHACPIGLHWQNNIEMDIFAGIKSETSSMLFNSDTIVENDVNYRVMLSQDLTYIPDTRTDVSLGYYVNYANILGTYDKNFMNMLRQGGDYLTCGLDLGANYYISPRFRLNLSINMAYQWVDSESNTSFGFNQTTYGLRNTYRSHPLQTDRSNTSFSLNLIYKIF